MRRRYRSVARRASRSERQPCLTLWARYACDAAAMNVSAALDRCERDFLTLAKAERLHPTLARVALDTLHGIVSTGSEGVALAAAELPDDARVELLMAAAGVMRAQSAAIHRVRRVVLRTRVESRLSA